MLKNLTQNPVTLLASIGGVVILTGVIIEAEVNYLVGVIMFWGGLCVVLSAGVVEMARKRREKASAEK